MTRFRGIVGFVTAGEHIDDVWVPLVVERRYKGDVLNETQNYVLNEQVNDDKKLSERISIVADAYSTQNYTDIRYVVKAGLRWSVTSVQVARPRLILSLGGVYRGEKPTPDPISPP